MVIADRFWPKVDRGSTDECWPWRGSLSSRGYGQFYMEGRTRPAHRVAWELHHGQLFPEGMDGCHTCDNPPCVNPLHIFPGTASDNARDAVAKGRLDPLGYAHRTECVRGHQYTPENTHIDPRGHRRCRTCIREANWKKRGRLAALTRSQP